MPRDVFVIFLDSFRFNKNVTNIFDDEKLMLLLLEALQMSQLFPKNFNQVMKDQGTYESVQPLS